MTQTMFEKLFLLTITKPTFSLFLGTFKSFFKKLFDLEKKILYFTSLLGYFCNEDDMERGVIDLGEIDISKTPEKVGGLEYTPTNRLGKIRWYVLDKTGRVLESLVSVHALTFSFNIGGMKYEIPVRADMINLDDRDFNGSDRAVLFYVLGHPEISFRLDSSKKNNALFDNTQEGFRGYLENILNKIQRGEFVEEKFQVLSSFQEK